MGSSLCLNHLGIFQDFSGNWRTIIKMGALPIGKSGAC